MRHSTHSDNLLPPTNVLCTCKPRSVEHECSFRPLKESEFLSLFVSHEFGKGTAYRVKRFAGCIYVFLANPVGSRNCHAFLWISGQTMGRSAESEAHTLLGKQLLCQGENNCCVRGPCMGRSLGIWIRNLGPWRILGYN